MNFQLPSP